MADVDIPSTPMLEMTRVKVMGSEASLERLQKAIDHITRKARANLPLTEDEGNFLVELYESFHWGGRFSGYAEASELAEHYVHGDGIDLRIDADVYRTSTIVRDVQRAMKSQILEDFTKTKLGNISLNSDSPRLQMRADFRVLREGRGRDPRKQGSVKYGGWLFTEQDNERLQKANNRFILKSTTSRTSTGFVSSWRVDDVYEFEPFAKEYRTEIQLRQGMVLVLHDGLSEYMTRVGLARKFNYFGHWQEAWTAADLATAAGPAVPKRPTPILTKREPKRRRARPGSNRAHGR